jgi:hypothetical protein
VCVLGGDDGWVDLLLLLLYILLYTHTLCLSLTCVCVLDGDDGRVDLGEVVVPQGDL